MKMNHIISADPIRIQRMNTKELRESFLLDKLFVWGQLNLFYIDVDRTIVGSAVPLNTEIKLDDPEELISEYFTENREIAVVNIGQKGAVTVDGKEFIMAKQDVLYIGRGSKDIFFKSFDAEKPALFYIASYNAHTTYPTALLKKEDAVVLDYGNEKEANKRKINCYFTEKGLKSCQLCLGITELAEGNVWNTMPSHLHPTRSEVYLYFDMDSDTVLFHFFGQPGETRHIIVKNNQAVISPSWSIHSGVATKRYTFLWVMGGENKKTLQIDGIKTTDLK